MFLDEKKSKSKIIMTGSQTTVHGPFFENGSDGFFEK
jgi:hypothetical protein